jgi:hypothetical protein
MMAGGGVTPWEEVEEVYCRIESGWEERRDRSCARHRRRWREERHQREVRLWDGEGT